MHLSFSWLRIGASPEAVAKKAYFSYLNGGSQPGQELKHWLEAEAQLIAGIDREMQIHPH